MTKQMMIGAAILAAAAGSASAQMNYSGLNNAGMFASVFARVNDTNNFYSVSPVDQLNPISMLTPRTEYNTSAVLNTAINPAFFNGASSGGLFAAEISSTRFELTWDLNTNASIAPGYTSNSSNFLNSELGVQSSGVIAFDADCQIRVTFNYGGDGFDISDGSSTAWLRVQNNANWPYGAFSSDSTNPGSLSAPLTFVVDMLAGQVFDFDLFVTSGAGSLSGLTEWDLDNYGTLTIEVIPAPSAAALLGLGGLVAARRRRA